jgi:Acyl-CoA carboxylase epsilon subunit
VSAAVAEEPLFRVVRGTVTPEELAALTVVLVRLARPRPAARDGRQVLNVPIRWSHRLSDCGPGQSWRSATQATWRLPQWV